MSAKREDEDPATWKAPKVTKVTIENLDAETEIRL
jgi:hypothetical protein